MIVMMSYPNTPRCQGCCRTQEWPSAPGLCKSPPRGPVLWSEDHFLEFCKSWVILLRVGLIYYSLKARWQGMINFDNKRKMDLQHTEILHKQDYGAWCHILTNLGTGWWIYVGFIWFILLEVTKKMRASCSGISVVLAILHLTILTNLFLLTLWGVLKYSKETPPPPILILCHKKH